MIYSLKKKDISVVLNLVISGIPSIRLKAVVSQLTDNSVLNLVISGIPSILRNAKEYSWSEVKF